MFYKNTSYSAKTFYGVTFGPGEIKEVEGIINNRWMIPANDPDTTVTKVQKEPSSGRPKKESGKPEHSKTNVKESEVKASDKQEAKLEDSKQEEKEDTEVPTEAK